MIFVVLYIVPIDGAYTENDTNKADVRPAIRSVKIQPAIVFNTIIPFNPLHFFKSSSDGYD